MLQALAEVLGAVLLLGGLMLATIGLIGMLRRRDIFEQLHAAGLITGAGAILVLVASVATGRSEIITSAILVVVFVLVTSSLSAHVVALAGLRRYEPALPGDSTGPDANPRDGAVPEAAVGLGPRRILLAHDASASARTAADLVAGVGWGAGTLVRIVAVQAESLPPVGSDGEAGSPGDDVRRRLQPALQEVADRLQAAGLRAETAMLEGDPVLAVVADARTSRADLVVVGTRTLGSRSWLDASTAGEIVDRAPCPVLVARTTAVREIVLSTDGSDASAAAADLLERWSVFAGARVRVLVVTSGRGAQVGDGGPAGRHASAVAERLRARGFEATAEVVEGSPAAAITAHAARTGADLIVIGSRGRTGLTRTVLGSVTREVLTTAECSVLVINV
jgi:monovalent cation/proton antiporter MnhG/PhaG subunit